MPELVEEPLDVDLAADPTDRRSRPRTRCHRGCEGLPHDILRREKPLAEKAAGREGPLEGLASH